MSHKEKKFQLLGDQTACITWTENGKGWVLYSHIFAKSCSQAEQKEPHPMSCWILCLLCFILMMHPFYLGENNKHEKKIGRFFMF